MSTYIQSRHARLVKLAGPATGSYDGGQKMSTQKRKRDKAQEQLRTRMRQRINGNGTSSSLIHQKRRSTLLDGSGDISLSASMGRHHSSTTVEVAAKDLQGSNYWRTQQDRYNSFQTTRSPRLSKNQTVPLQELVDRVLHRKEHNFGLDTKASPMTIRAYKTPVAPYAIQQSSLVKKMVMMKPIQRQEREDKGPFVLVLQRDGGDDVEAHVKGHRRLGSNANPESDGPSDSHESRPTMSTNQVLPPVNGGKTSDQSQLEMKTWRPPMDSVNHQPSVIPEAEDRSVTNYRLQLQHANKLAESRFDFPQCRDSSGMTSHHQSVEEMTMQSLNPLPPIQTVISGGGSTEESDSASNTVDASMNADGNASSRSKTSNANANNSGAAGRTQSKDEILNMRKAQKEAKRQKQSDEDFTLLRTRKRFTNKTKQFKSELQRARQLSAIQEDRSSLSSARLSRLSGRKPSMSSSSSSSASSLRSIDESNVSCSSDQQHRGGGWTDLVDVAESPGEANRSNSEQSNHAVPPAVPPSTPSIEDVAMDDGGASTRDNNSDTVDDADSSMDEGGSVTSSSDESNTSEEEKEEDEEAEEEGSSNSRHSEKPGENEPQPQVIQGDNVFEEMTWIDGEVPFSENAPSLQADPADEHGR